MNVLHKATQRQRASTTIRGEGKQWFTYYVFLVWIARSLDSLTTATDPTLSFSLPEPSAISPNAFNIVVDEYNDADCTDPTGNQEVVSGSHLIQGSTSGTCYQIGTSYALSECLADGSLISQVFGEGDSTCTGDVYAETASTSAFVDVCDVFVGGDLYYK